MDSLKLQRKYTRTSFTKCCNTLLEEINKSEQDNELIKINMTKLERLFAELKDFDSQIINLVLQERNEDIFKDEYMTIEGYKDNFDMVRQKVSNYLSHVENKQKENIEFSGYSSPVCSRRKLKLPKIELKKFGGEVKEWLSFWSQFKRIHDDEGIRAEDKFQYLIQAMISDTRAKSIVDSFPPTAENYEKVIDVLKNRFGREEILTEYYVRELIGLVIKNTNTNKERLNITQLYDKLESYLRALESIGMTQDKYAAMLFPLVESCVPEDILRAWIRSPLHKQVEVEVDDSSSSYNNRLQQLLAFLRCEVEGEERISMAKSGFKGTSNSSYNKDYQKKKTVEVDVPTASSLFSGGNNTTNSNRKPVSTMCIFCDKPHESKECFHAQKMSFEQKKEFVNKKKGCYLCLKIGHLSKNCKSSIKCIVCSKRHTTIMCPNLKGTQTTNPSHKCEDPKQSENKTESTNLASQSSSKVVFLQTLIVNLKHNQNTMSVRALIDSGSQRSYILKHVAEQMKLTENGCEELVHTLFGGIKTKSNLHKRYKLNVSNIKNDFTCTFNVLEQPIICNSVPKLKHGQWLLELQDRGIWLSDVGDQNCQIELLFGADVLGSLLTGKTEKLDCGLLATETVLGWTVMGSLKEDMHSCTYGTLINNLFIQSNSLTDLWSMDVLGITDPYEHKHKKEMEVAVIQHFKDTVTINAEGRYEVLLPWTENKEQLETNKHIAEKRLLVTTSKLRKDNRFQDYDKVLKNWENLGIICEVKEENKRVKGCFLPHRAVIKEQATTKIRPVFDASCKAPGCPSLNDCLEKGPNVIEQIPSILVKFREKRVGVTSDIEKAFLQISLNESDCDYLKFLWWENFDLKSMRVLQHRRLVFGLNCSPFILGAVINHHLENCPSEYSKIADVLRKSFYVDNCVTSLDSYEELQEFVKKSTILMSTAKFNLRDWKYTSHKKVLMNMNTGVLGLRWDTSSDMLYCDLQNIEMPTQITRRTILSSVHRIFDPIGFTCPTIIVPKILLQESWRSKSSWDDEVSSEIKKRFVQWHNELSMLPLVRIPRWMASTANSSSWSIHVFCDASKVAYSTVIFLRSVNGNVVNVQLMMAKSRIAPLKMMSIPRLELMACCIGARLARVVTDSLEVKDLPVYFWTDSTTVLYWIKSDELWSTFVQNRVKEIRQITNGNWNHVIGKCNPADLPSRGCSVKALVESQWWEGPSWLRLNEVEWPKSSFEYKEEEIQIEKRKTDKVSLFIVKEDDPWYLKFFSHYSKIIRMLGWMLRFVNNCKGQKEQLLTGELTVAEIYNAEKTLLRIVQKESFTGNGKQDLKSLCTVQGKDGLIRAETKITTRLNESEDFKWPIILPNKNRLVRLMILEEHKKMSHAGVNVILNKLRERFWILKGRMAVRSVINKCVICKRFGKQHVQTPPVSLPADRVNDSSVFNVTGVDLAGPLILKGNKKAWIVLFTCAVYRAIHLELVTSLSTDGFLLGMRRFIARRGRPSTIYSDNGTNFIGADNLFKTIDWNVVEKHTTTTFRIQWKFIPPTAAWWGGWWERMIQMVKKLIRCVLGRACLNYEEMNSILCDCEAVINSRPLTYLSEDPNGITPVSPAMFLQDIYNSKVTDIDEIDSGSLSKRIKYQQRLRENLRKRFRNEYLSELILHRGKFQDKINLKVGDIVLIGSDIKKRIDWPLGRVTELYPGKDGVVRVAKIKTASSEFIRPVQRLYPLEVSSEDQTEMSGISKGDRDISQTKEEAVPETTNSTKTIKTISGRIVKIPRKLLQFEL